MPISMPITMPTTANPARWSDIVDDFGDEKMEVTSETCNKEEDEQMCDGEASPAASYCSTQFSWGDEPQCEQSAHPIGFDSPQYVASAPSMEWTPNASLPPPGDARPLVFAAYPIFPVVAAYPSNMPVQVATQSGNQELQCVSQPAAGCFKKGRADIVKKRFLKKGSQEGMRQHPAVKQSSKGLASRTLPEASEQDWQRRLQKRHNIVAMVKGTPEYQAFAANRRGGTCRRATLRTPSPNDKSVSKRQWEEKVHYWRNALRTWNPN